MVTELVNIFQGLPKELITTLIAMIPIAELRGAIPWALANLPFGGGLSWTEAYIYAVIGNMIPIFPILLLFDKVYLKLNKYPLFNRFFNWLFTRTRKRGKDIAKYKELGLIIFVGIPLPATGAWTGAVAAFVFGLSIKRAMVCIFIGVLLAGVIVTLTSLGVINALKVL